MFIQTWKIKLIEIKNLFCVYQIFWVLDYDVLVVMFVTQLLIYYRMNYSTKFANLVTSNYNKFKTKRDKKFKYIKNSNSIWYKISFIFILCMKNENKYMTHCILDTFILLK